MAHYADQPVSECDLHARHSWLVRSRDLLRARLEGDLEYYDPIIAGYWVWGICTWIGGGFCSGKGPWHSVDGHLVKLDSAQAEGIVRKRVHLANSGWGVHRKIVQLRDGGQGVHRPTMRQSHLIDWMQALAERLRYVRVACGDWTRVMGPAITHQQRLNGIFLDPPYLRTERTQDVYRVENDVSEAVRQWAIDHGDHPKLRIVLCGYEGEHDMPDTWRKIAWRTNGGYANAGKASRGRDNAKRERLWLSPHCLEVEA